MKLAFEKRRAILSGVSPRAEITDEELTPAADLRFDFVFPNDVLAEFDPALKSALYWFDESRAADLAEQGKKDEPGFLPHLRFPNLKAPLRWDDELVGARVVIDVGIGARGAIVLEATRVDSFALEPRDRGVVGVSMRVQAKPDERQFGRLAMLVKHEVEVTVSPPE